LTEPAKTSNRLSRTRIGATVEPYSHDAHGNMTRMAHLPLMRWDFEDQLQATSQQVVTNGGTPEITYYVYDAAGQRVRKVAERQAGSGQTPTRMKERIYLGGFEIYREYAGDGQAVTLERETLHLMDGQQRIALVETLTVEDSLSLGERARVRARYQLGNHLGSASLELDSAAQIISYEEYYPYGSTSYQAVRSQTETPKRYRYTGKERDEESGLYYHETRYYAAWLGRWTAADRAGLAGGANAYAYTRNNALKLTDPSGMNGEQPKLMGEWPYGADVPGKAALGKNIQGDHPIQVALRKLETLGEYNRAVSKAEKEFVILAETGKGLFHTELGKLQLDIAKRKVAGDLYQGLKSALENYAKATGEAISIPKPDPRLILSETQLIEETRQAYQAAARATGAVVDEAALSRVLLSHMGTLSTTGGNVTSKLEAAPSLAKMVEVIGGMSRFSKALEMIQPILTVAKPLMKKLGPVGIVLGVLSFGTEAHAAVTAPTGGDAAVHGLNTVKEGFYLAGFRHPAFLIPAVSMSATQTIDEKLGITDTAARDAVELKEKVKGLTGSETLSHVAGATVSIGLSWGYFLNPVGYGLRRALKK
ncbi:MAG: RHS repeat-associated core domain-containing protein, partial [Gemmatales bacterium]|nr:RHS repeat-associated core domain-containing protein [Gemmatales bacterium]